MGVGGSMNIIFKADLSKYVAHRPSVLYWVVQPAPMSAASAWALCGWCGPGTNG
jgi:hypothetical protein